MKSARRAVLAATWFAIAASSIPHAAAGQVNRYVRYETGGAASYGLVDGDRIHQLSGNPIDGATRTGTSLAMSDATLLAPVVPGKVIAVGLNYRSHIGNAEPAEYPGLFAKMPTSIVGPGADIVMPPDAENVHYEGELVVVIGKRATAVTPEAASDYIFGVTAGNDVSERDWQRNDLQWFRAKASDTFGPIGPMVVTGLDYNDLHVETRLNGEVRQSESSADLIFDIDHIVSYISHYVTLEPGDLIFTGTPGSTRAMADGDVVEIEVEGVGILRNPVVQGGHR
ncbi:MAG: fumarylacetoacetate hydrolase family protein [Gemmatimonadota bacterium]